MPLQQATGFVRGPALDGKIARIGGRFGRVVIPPLGPQVDVEHLGRNVEHVCALQHLHPAQIAYGGHELVPGHPGVLLDQRRYAVKLAAVGAAVPKRLEEAQPFQRRLSRIKLAPARVALPGDMPIPDRHGVRIPQRVAGIVPQVGARDMGGARRSPAVLRPRARVCACSRIRRQYLAELGIGQHRHAHVLRAVSALDLLAVYAHKPHPARAFCAVPDAYLL